MRKTLEQIKPQEQAPAGPTDITRTDLQLADLQTLQPLLQPGLLTLNVSSNHLTAVPGLPASLRILNLSANRLSDSRPLAGLLNLESLDLSFNRLITFEPAELPNLESLDLANNQLTSVRSLDKLRSLVSIRVDRNQLKSLRFLSTNIKVSPSHRALRNQRKRKLHFRSQAQRPECTGKPPHPRPLEERTPRGRLHRESAQARGTLALTRHSPSPTTRSSR